MTCIAVVGGKLQGVEILYLAMKAGIQTILIDENSEAAAVNLCDTFIEHEFTKENPVPDIGSSLDPILPATLV